MAYRLRNIHVILRKFCCAFRNFAVRNGRGLQFDDINPFLIGSVASKLDNIGCRINHFNISNLLGFNFEFA